MSSAKLTLIGLYSYEPTLFDYLILPEGIDKDTLVDNILMRSGDFEALYPDPDFMKFAIGAWCRKWTPTLQRWIDALSIEYSPLENYDRYEHWTDEKDATTTGHASGNTSGKTHSVNTGKVSAYDAGDTFTNKDQGIIDGTDTGTSSSNSSVTLDDDNEHDGRIHGNIGVTTSQQMLISELDLGYWNIYEKITDLFLTEFVLPVY